MNYFYEYRKYVKVSLLATATFEQLNYKKLGQMAKRNGTINKDVDAYILINFKM